MGGWRVRRRIEASVARFGTGPSPRRRQKPAFSSFLLDDAICKVLGSRHAAVSVDTTQFPSNSRIFGAVMLVFNVRDYSPGSRSAINFPQGLVRVQWRVPCLHCVSAVESIFIRPQGETNTAYTCGLRSYITLWEKKHVCLNLESNGKFRVLFLRVVYGWDHLSIDSRSWLNTIRLMNCNG